MSGVKSLKASADAIYIYDGSFPGFLCCVFESVYSRQMPVDIVPHEKAPLTLLDTKHIATDMQKARRVRDSISKKISMGALDLVSTVFLSCLEQKELKMLAFLLKGYGQGGRLLNSLGDPVLSPLLKARKHLMGEAHLLTGFVRFSDIGGVLVSTITPKNYILPFIKKHFTTRFREENFIIFDKTNRAALFYQNGKSKIVEADSFEPGDISPEEANYQSLWKRFYDTIAIEGRENPRCRMTHMPKRYWENMLEVRDLL